MKRHLCIHGVLSVLILLLVDASVFAQPGARFNYSTFLGGSQQDFASRVAVDAAGNVYVTGTTFSSDFPTLNAFQTSNHGGADVFIEKFAPDGTLLYSTYFGGRGDDVGTDIAVDGAGKVYIVGYTQSPDFPLLGQGQALSGPQDGFLIQLDSSGKPSLVRLFGGKGTDAINAIARDGLGNIALAGVTDSPDFPPAASGNSQDAFVERLTPSGEIVFVKRLGGSAEDAAMGVATDNGGGTIVTGFTLSSDFPLGEPIQAAPGGQGDCFVTRLNAAGQISFSTYLGGRGSDFCTAVAVGRGSITVVGGTASTDFPVRRAFQPQSGGGSDAFVTRFYASGTSIMFSTYFGGNDSDTALAVAVDTAGATYVSGRTFSTNLPLANPLQSVNHGGFDVLALKLDAMGNPVFSTYIGGHSDEAGNGIAADSEGNIYIAGATGSADFPTARAYASRLLGTLNGFLLRIDSVQTRPPNDDFQNAAAIGGASGTTTGTNIGATGEPGEPVAPSAGRTSIWWKWTAPFDGTATFNTLGSGFDTVLAIYQGNALNTLTLITSDNGSGSQNSSLASFAATAGAQYMVTVSGFSDTSGNVVLRWNLRPSPLAVQDVTIIGVPQIGEPATQQRVRVHLQHPFQFALSGQLILTFIPDAIVFSSDDDSIQFEGGGRTVTFTIPAGAVDGLFSDGQPSAGFQTGTLAGAITLSTTFQALGEDVSPSPWPSATVVIQPRVPVISDVAIVSTGPKSFQLTVTGFVTSQEVTKATFVFASTAGSNLQNSTVTLDVADLFQQWFQDPASLLHGTKFRFSVEFTVQSGNRSYLAWVSVALSNKMGNSTGVTRTLSAPN